MRGETERQATLLLELTPDGFVPRDHPLRRIKPLVDSALRRMSPLFDQVYAAGGRPSIPPEHLHKSNLLMACYTIRSERQFCEQLRYNILFKWFLDLNVEYEPFHPTTFTENRERLMQADPYSSQGQAAALEKLERSVCGPATMGADRADDTRDFVWTARGWCVTPHMAQHDPGRRSAIDGRTTRHAGCRQSQRRRKRVEEVLGWTKTIGGGGNLRVLGRARNKLWFELTAAAYILNSPSDPTGGVVGRDVLDRLVVGLEQHPQVATMCDEICDQFLYGGREHVSLLDYASIRW